MAGRRFIFAAIAAMGTAFAFGQRRIVYSFDSAQIEQWNRFYGVRQVRIVQKPGISHRRPDLGESVSVIGNFGGTFTVHGAGTATSARGDNLIDIVTNRSLTFQAANFTILYNGAAQANTAGSIAYEMQLYAGTAGSVGAPITSAVGGTDNGFNGASITLPLGSIPGNGECVLRLSRTLSLTQFAAGNTTYTATGTIVLTIN